MEIPDLGGAINAMSREGLQIAREKHQREVRAQEATVQTTMMLAQIHKQGAQQIELLAAIKGLLERLAPPIAPAERPSLAAALTYIDEK